MIATSSLGWGWHLGLTSLLAVGGAIASLGDCALAQIKSDGTLPNNSIVTPQGNISLIEGGTQAGSNLFHSFEQFSVPTGGAAYFNNASAIQNIISRVTGSSISNIDGLLRANGTANLFLLNPNGIIFGPNASLDIGGSFLGSTTSSLNFADGKQFSATAPQTTPLLTVSVPLGLQYGSNAGSVRVQESGLQVQDGQTLALIGGDVRVEGGKSRFLSAPGGRIELGGLAGAGMVEIEGQQSEGAFKLTSLRFPDLVERADVLLTNSAYVNVTASGDGSIAINARNIDISGSSALSGGLETNSGFLGATAGDITLNATGAIAIANSFIANNVRIGAVGNGGDVNIKTGSLSVTDGAQLQAITFGQGDAGSVSINARDTVSFDGESSNGLSSAAFSTVQKGAVGNGGDINITTGSLEVTNGAELLAYTNGRGDAGSVNINARDTVSFDRVGGGASGAFSTVDPGAVGNGGGINITTGSLAVMNGAQLAVSIYGFGQGDAGSVNINARDTVSFDGESSTEVSSGAFSTVEPGAVGNGGGVNITTGSLSVTNGAYLEASTFEQGDAGSMNINARDTVSFDGGDAFSGVGSKAMGNGGNIVITAGSLYLTDGAYLEVSTLGQGNAGRVTINARDNVSLDYSPLRSIVDKNAEGRGGNINITTGSLSLTDGAQLDASTFGQGNAGNVIINARDTVSLDGTTPDGLRKSVIFSEVDEGAMGNGGKIEITTSSLYVTNGAALNNRTLGRGNAGSIIVRARDTVSFDGVDSDGLPSAAYSTVEPGAVGNGGGINITTGLLSVTNGAGLTASSEGSGAAGNIEVAARSMRLDNLAFLSSDTTAGQGNIFLRSEDLVLRRGSNITTDATGTATGGNINIDTDVMVALENSDIRANAQEGFGGRVIINAQGIFGTEFRNQQTPESDITASSNIGSEFSGTVEINTLDIDPSQGLATLPAELVDASGLIATGCGSGGRQGESKFIITGRGELPIRPTDAHISYYPTGTVRSIPSSHRSSETPRSSVLSSNLSTNATREPAPTQIVEAQGWMINNLGEVVLTAQATNVTLNIPWMNPATCHGSATSRQQPFALGTH